MSAHYAGGCESPNRVIVGQRGKALTAPSQKKEIPEFKAM